jgi:hypothetical protein
MTTYGAAELTLMKSEHNYSSISEMNSEAVSLLKLKAPVNQDSSRQPLTVTVASSVKFELASSYQPIILVHAFGPFGHFEVSRSSDHSGARYIP